MGLRILIVDDNEDAAQTLAVLLEMSGHVVRVAHSAPDALNLFDEFDPDVAFCDIGMPFVSGWELAERVRASGNRVTLVALTGLTQAADRELSDAAGFDFHLAKPAAFSAVLLVVNAVAARLKPA